MVYGFCTSTTKQVLGIFIWSGKLERLQLNVLKNSNSSGGLNLPCIFSKECIMLRNPEAKHFGHLRYWVGLHLRDYFPSMSAGLHAHIISPVFQHLRLLLVEGLVLGDVNAGNLKKVYCSE